MLHGERELFGDLAIFGDSFGESFVLKTDTILCTPILCTIFFFTFFHFFNALSSFLENLSVSVAVKLC